MLKTIISKFRKINEFISYANKKDFLIILLTIFFYDSIIPGTIFILVYFLDFYPTGSIQNFD